MFFSRTINSLKQPNKAKIATLQIISTYKSPSQFSSVILLQQERGCVNYTLLYETEIKSPTRLYAEFPNNQQNGLDLWIWASHNGTDGGHCRISCSSHIPPCLGPLNLTGILLMSRDRFSDS